LRVGVEKLDNGCTIIDAGIKVPGGIEAVESLPKSAFGGMGTVTISHSPYTANWPLSVNVHTGNRFLGCLGSQYAGWSLSHEEIYAPAQARARHGNKIKDGQQEPVKNSTGTGYHDEADARFSD